MTTNKDVEKDLKEKNKKVFADSVLFTNIGS